MESAGGRGTGRSHGACLESGFSVLPPRVSLYSRPGLRCAPSGLRGDGGLRNGGSVARMKCNGIRVGGGHRSLPWRVPRIRIFCTPASGFAVLPTRTPLRSLRATWRCGATQRRLCSPDEMQWNPRGGGAPGAPMARASNPDFLYSRLGFRCTPDPDSAALPPGYVAMGGYATAVL